jgi:hypothetical protein
MDKKLYSLKTVEKFEAASEEKIFIASRSNEC